MSSTDRKTPTIVPPKGSLPILPSDQEDRFPVLPLQTGVLFPGTMMTLQIGRLDNLELIRYCLDGKREFVASYSSSHPGDQNGGSIHQVGVTATVRDSREGPADSLVVTLEGMQRVVITKIVSQKPYLMATVSYLQWPKSVNRKLKTKVDAVISIAKEITELDPGYSSEVLNVLRMNQNDPSLLADKAASLFHFPLSSKQKLLDTADLKKRYENLLSNLNAELNRVATSRSIDENVKSTIAEEQKRSYLKQQLHEIRRQLGEDLSEEREAVRFHKILKDTPKLPSEVVARATIEIDRLSQLSPASAEYGDVKSYLDWILAMPWGKCTPEDYEIADVSRILEKDYYGPANIREQILERLSVRKLAGGANVIPTLCLVGAPGTGKASLAKAIAHALGKEFVRISVGGISDVAEVKGSPRTFMGAMPGKIVRTLRDAGTCDPVVLIEDIDYFNMDNDSSVNTALLEVVDNRWNSRFLDNYLGVHFDFSRILFICSVRSFEEIPEQFIPRFEILELPGYIEREKIAISKKFLIPRLLKAHGLRKSELSFTDKILTRIISNYTMEAGLLGFSQQIEKICRKVTLAKSAKPRKSWSINERNIISYLGPPIYIPERAVSTPEIGTAAGLAWTGAGGDLMFIEGLKMKGEGQIITTGSLGEVMRESILAAHSYVRSKSDVLGIDSNDFSQFDIHIHFPSGAIPKDGPSAGVTVCLVIASVMAERPIRNDVAVTGEVTLRGRVLQVGGIKEKISAAYRAGISHVAMPKENEKDIKDLPKEILRKLKFTFIERVDELFEVCLLDFTPSSYTLEKIFAEEIEKAKKRKSRSVRKSTVKKSAARRNTGKKK
ncbi:MAG: endopeptidase La [candidate division Zixibacteria bacterium]|nr:endopeptidase La [candidate division Zixibacteria bacterium]